MSKIDEIRRRRSLVTQIVYPTGTTNKADYEFFVNAPADIDYLISCIEGEKQGKNSATHTDRIQIPPPAHVTFDKNGRAHADLDRLIDNVLEATTTPTAGGEHQCQPCGYHRAVCCQCRSILVTEATDAGGERCAERDVKDRWRELPHWSEPPHEASAFNRLLEPLAHALASITSDTNPLVQVPNEYSKRVWTEFWHAERQLLAFDKRVFPAPPESVRCVHCGATRHSYNQDWDHPFESLASTVTPVPAEAAAQDEPDIYDAVAELRQRSIDDVIESDSGLKEAFDIQQPKSYQPSTATTSAAVEGTCAGCNKQCDVGLLLCPTCVDEGHAECCPPTAAAMPAGGVTMTTLRLPLWSECEAACDNLTASPLEGFIYNYEPGDNDTEWRNGLIRILATARADAIDEAISELAERRKAYRESVFTPLAEGETAKVHEQWPGLVDRMSADVCRWILDDMASELEALKQDDGQRSD